jgi:hypothetical protein
MILPPWISVPVALLKGVPRWVWAVLAVAVLLAGVWLHGRSAGADSVQARWDEQEAAYAVQRSKAADAARKTEERHRAEYRAIADRFLAEQKEADENHAAVVAGLRAGTIRVRHRLTCPGVPGTAADPTGTAEEGPRGLQPEDAGIAIGIGAEADEVARRLNALIEAVKAGQR